MKVKFITDFGEGFMSFKKDSVHKVIEKIKKGKRCPYDKYSLEVSNQNTTALINVPEYFVIEVKS